MKFKAPSSISILALYLALNAARHHAVAVRFSTENLRLCLGKKNGERLSQAQIQKFADAFKPIFRHHAINRDRYKNMWLTLYFNEDDAPAHREQIINGACFSHSVVNKELGIESID
jgi:hypothetical protein